MGFLGSMTFSPFSLALTFLATSLKPYKLRGSTDFTICSQYQQGRSSLNFSIKFNSYTRINMVLGYLIFPFTYLLMKNIDFTKIKRNFEKKFPELEISQVLSSEPDQMNVENLIAKVGTWLAICDLERRNKNLGDEARVGGFRHEQS